MLGVGLVVVVVIVDVDVVVTVVVVLILPSTGVDGDSGLEPGETLCLCVFPGSSPVSRFTSSVPIHPG